MDVKDFANRKTWKINQKNNTRTSKNNTRTSKKYAIYLKYENRNSLEILHTVTASQTKPTQRFSTFGI